MAINELIYPIIQKLNNVETKKTQKSKTTQPARRFYARTEHYIENKFHGTLVTVGGKLDYCIEVVGMSSLIMVWRYKLIFKQMATKVMSRS